MRDERESGFSLVEVLVGMTVLLLVLASFATLFAHNARVNRSQQLTADVQANARGCLDLVVQKLRTAGWDPSEAGITTVGLDPDPTDTTSQIEIFADHDGDGLTDKVDEQILIRHSGDRLEWRTSATGVFEPVAYDITNDADGDGIPEPMFLPSSIPDPRSIRVRVTARSRTRDPLRDDYLRYTVEAEVVLRKEL